MISRQRDGSYILTDPNNPSRTQMVPAGQDVDAAAAAFFGPPVLQVPESFSQVTITEFIEAIAPERGWTPAQKTNILNRLKR